MKVTDGIEMFISPVSSVSCALPLCCSSRVCCRVQPVARGSDPSPVRTAAVAAADGYGLVVGSPTSLKLKPPVTVDLLSPGSTECCSPLGTHSGGDGVPRNAGTSPFQFGHGADVELLLRTSGRLLTLVSAHSVRVAGVKARTDLALSANAHPGRVTC